MIRHNLKPAIISAVVVVILTGLLMGVRLGQAGTGLTVTGAGTDVLWKIALAATFIFFYNLFRDQLKALWQAVPGLPQTPPKLSDIKDSPVFQRLFWCFLIAAAIVFPF
ncbi:MAG: DUF3382 domain-containing protein, partial [Pseudomonas sp.]